MRVGANGGLTLVEVLISLAILGVVSGILAMSLVSSVRHNAVSSQRGQAVQILNYLGRRVAGGDGVVLPTAGQTLAWNYEELESTFADLSLDDEFAGTGDEGVANSDLYRASIDRVGDITLSTASLVEYEVEVCYLRSDAEHCVRGTTVGPEKLAPGTPPALPDFY